LRLVLAQDLSTDAFDVSVSFLFFLVEGVILNYICADSGFNGIHVEIVHNVLIYLCQLENLAMHGGVYYWGGQMTRVVSGG
jgi:hypothetical protein